MYRLVVLLSLAYFWPVVAQSLPVGYSDSVLEILDDRWLYRGRVDWSQFRSDVEVWREDSEGVDEFNARLIEAFEATGDRHSRILSLEVAATRGSDVRFGFGLGLTEAGIVRTVYPGSPADAAGIRVGERIVSVDGVPVATQAGWERLANPSPGISELVLESVHGDRRTVGLSAAEFSPYLAPNSRHLAPGIWLIVLPPHSGSGMIPGVGSYAALVRDAITDLKGSCGLVVDLRRNSGGNMWPMLEGVLPLLPVGPAGSVSYASGTLADWSGGLGEVGIPIAVLTSSSTASSGEALVVAFKGRPQTRFFGEATFGTPTSIRSHPLPAGYWLYLAEGAFVDRSGHVYSGPIAPDESVPVDWALVGTPADPVLQASMLWLSQQECGSSRS